METWLLAGAQEGGLPLGATPGVAATLAAAHLLPAGLSAGVLIRGPEREEATSGEAATNAALLRLVALVTEAALLGLVGAALATEEEVMARTQMLLLMLLCRLPQLVQLRQWNRWSVRNKESRRGSAKKWHLSCWNVQSVRRIIT